MYAGDVTVSQAAAVIFNTTLSMVLENDTAAYLDGAPPPLCVDASTGCEQGSVVLAMTNCLVPNCFQTDFRAVWAYETTLVVIDST